MTIATAIAIPCDRFEDMVLENHVRHIKRWMYNLREGLANEPLGCTVTWLLGLARLSICIYIYIYIIHVYKYKYIDIYKRLYIIYIYNAMLLVTHSA